MEFEWDEAKRRANIKKHGIDFDEATAAFNPAMDSRLDTRQDYGEDRYRGTGLIQGRVAVIVYTVREPDTYRIISARKADKHEKEAYYKKNRI